MKNNSFQKRLLASGSALQVLAMAGGGLAVASIAAPAAAQDYTAGAVSGTVVDDAGAPVAGATVSATSVSQGFTRTATTGANGSFSFNSLPSGSYNITVTGSGIADYTAENVRVLGGQSVNVELAVSATNVIVVSGQSIVKAFEGTTTGLNVDVTELFTTTPIIIRVPIKDWMLSVVPGMYSAPRTPEIPRGTASMMISGSVKERNCASMTR